MKPVFALFLIMGISTMTHGLTLESTSFKHNELMSSKYTCDGANISPELRWAGAPEGTKSFALIVDDPDAPKKTYVHWIVFNIPASVTNLAENSKPIYPSGINDFGKQTWGGPCPPSGTHRYYFKLYALDTILDIKSGITKDELLNVMNGHIIAQAELIGRYTRTK